MTEVLQPADAPPAAVPLADRCMLKVLCIPSAAERPSEASLQQLVSTSMLLSATRCLLGYIVFPLVLPLIGAAGIVGPVIGIPVGVVALVFDVKGIRRFWVANHRHRWPFTLLYFTVATMVTVLLVTDVVHLAH